MRLGHDAAWLWEERTDSRNVCLKRKEVLIMLCYIYKNWNHFIKEYLEWFSKFAFQEVACPLVRPNRYILEILLARRHTLVAQNRPASVRLHHIFSMLHLSVWYVEKIIKSQWKNTRLFEIWRDYVCDRYSRWNQTSNEQIVN